jgi:hypothetical protein
MSKLVVRNRYTAVNVAEANSAAAFSRVTFVSSARYVLSALFMRLAAKTCISLRWGVLRSCKRPRCSDEIESTQLRR